MSKLFFSPNKKERINTQDLQTRDSEKPPAWQATCFTDDSAKDLSHGLLIFRQIGINSSPGFFFVPSETV